jgi:predicted ArsR family transcriptional regulator
MRDFIKRGEVERIRPGVIRYVWKKNKGIRPADKTRCMYRLIRANKRESITVDDLRANCRVSRAAAREYLQLLVRREIMRRIDMPGNQPSKYRMINDPGPNLMKNEDNAAKMRAIRAAKKNTEAAIDQAAQSLIGATQALAQLKTALGDIPEDDNAEF